MSDPGLGFFVWYVVKGIGECAAGPYDSYPEARIHASDIAGFDGVLSVWIEARIERAQLADLLRAVLGMPGVH